jgi:hypothetical protein
MAQYTTPLREMQFVLHELLEVEKQYQEMPRHAEVGRELIDQVIEEGGRFCAEVLHPINRSGDEEGCTMTGDGDVRTPKGFKQAWDTYVAGGWPALSADPDFGGQGLPHTVQTAMQEMMNACNQAFTMYPGLTHGAYQALLAHGTPEQKALYLPKMVSGAWTGTMCLTEPHCGTDLGCCQRPSPRPTAATGSPAPRSSSPPASTTSLPTFSTWCWRGCRTRLLAPRAFRCSSCPSSCLTRRASRARATR